jgi:hypothetical protein
MARDTVYPKNAHYGPRKGLEGPFEYPNGRILYYDPVEGKYWDPGTDFFLEEDEVAILQQSLFDCLGKFTESEKTP